MGIKELVEIFQSGGAAALFLALYLVTLWYFFKQMKSQQADMKKNKDEAVSTTAQVAAALERSREATERNTAMMDSVKISLDENRAQTREFMAYLRGRDARAPE